MPLNLHEPLVGSCLQVIRDVSCCCVARHRASSWASTIVTCILQLASAVGYSLGCWDTVPFPVITVMTVIQLHTAIGHAVQLDACQAYVDMYQGIQIARLLLASKGPRPYTLHVLLLSSKA